MEFLHSTPVTLPFENHLNYERSKLPNSGSENQSLRAAFSEGFIERSADLALPTCVEYCRSTIAVQLPWLDPLDRAQP